MQGRLPFCTQNLPASKERVWLSIKTLGEELFLQLPYPQITEFLHSFIFYFGRKERSIEITFLIISILLKSFPLNNCLFHNFAQIRKNIMTG